RIFVRPVAPPPCHALGADAHRWRGRKNRARSHVHARAEAGCHITVSVWRNRLCGRKTLLAALGGGLLLSEHHVVLLAVTYSSSAWPITSDIGIRPSLARRSTASRTAGRTAIRAVQTSRW